MSFIDRSYFVVELSIAKLDTVPVQEIVDALIQKREPELLREILGYRLYKSLMSGLQADPIDPIWTDLLLGAEYTDTHNRVRKWDGLVSDASAVLGINGPALQVPVVIDADMVESQTITVPADMVGRDWSLEKRSLGPLREDEYTVSDDDMSVAVSFPVVLSDTYFFTAIDTSFSLSNISTKQSLIANYVYYWFMRNNASTTTATGETANTSENSTLTGPAVKQARAWNEMIDRIYECWHFLQNKRTVYTDWDWRIPGSLRQDYHHTNRF